jgi:RNA polymerase sigma factor (sigma-70 family)
VGETLFHAGTPGAHVYLIREGRVRVLRETKGGREVSFGTYGPGDLFGEYALLAPGKNTATCRAGGPTRLVRLPLQPLRQAVSERQGVRERLKAWLRLHAALDHLRGSPYLGFLSAPSVLQLADHFEALRFEAGHTLQADGLNTDRFFLIRSGKVLLQPSSTDGSAPPLELGPGDCFGARALLGDPGLPTAEAAGEVECSALRRAAFQSSTAGGNMTSVQTFGKVLPNRRPYPWIGQEGATDCGTACLAMVARYHNLETPVAAIRERLPTGERGSSLMELGRAAESLGFRARAVRLAPGHLAETTFPAVAHLAGGHYVVLYELHVGGVVVGDPAAGILTIDAIAFQKAWSGHLLLVTPKGNETTLSVKLPARAAMPSDPSLHSTQLHAYLDRIRAGDREAADTLLRQVCGRLERLAHSMLRRFPNVKRWADTGDVLQNALVRLLHTLEAVRPEGTRDFINLAAVHIRRELLDLARHYRQHLDQLAAAAGESSDEGLEELPDPNAVAEELDLWSQFHEQVERLPAQEREVVGLIFYHGCSQVEIAALFRVDERTIRRRWRSACLRLTEALGGRLPQP